MLELNKKLYKLCLLDTNILSEMLKNKRLYFKAILELYPLSENIFCYSVFSVAEIRRSKHLFDVFTDVFSIFPSLIMNGHEEIFQEELRHYKDPEHEIKAWAVAPFAIKSEQPLSSKKKLELVFSHKYVTSKERHWSNNINEILTGILQLKRNYPAKNGKYSTEDILNFVDIVTTQQIILGARSFVENEISSGKEINIHLFPSVKAIAYTVFYKFYPDKTKPKKSDVFDILISALLPYVDVFVTEAHQNELINKIKKIDNFLKHLQNISIKEINPDMLMKDKG